MPNRPTLRCPGVRCRDDRIRDDLHSDNDGRFRGGKPPAGHPRRQRQPGRRHDRVRHRRLGRAHDRAGLPAAHNHGPRDDRRLHAVGGFAQHEPGQPGSQHGPDDRDRRDQRRRRAVPFRRGRRRHDPRARRQPVHRQGRRDDRRALGFRPRGLLHRHQRGGNAGARAVRRRRQSALPDQRPDRRHDPGRPEPGLRRQPVRRSHRLRRGDHGAGLEFARRGQPGRHGHHRPSSPRGGASLVDQHRRRHQQRRGRHRGRRPQRLRRRRLRGRPGNRIEGNFVGLDVTGTIVIAELRRHHRQRRRQHGRRLGGRGR